MNNLLHNFVCRPTRGCCRAAWAALLVLLLATGCGRAKRAAGDAASAATDATKAVATKAGKVVGEHVGGFFSGVGEGVEASVCDFPVRIDDPALAEAGVTVTLVRHVRDKPDAPVLSLYVLNEEPVTGALRLRFLTEDGREIGRGETAIDRAADGAGYVRIPLEKDIPTGLVRTVSLSLATPPSAE